MLGAGGAIRAAAAASALATCAAPAPDARDLFERAAERIELHDGFQYSFEYRETSASGQPGAALVGRAVVQRLDLSGGAYRARIHGWRKSDAQPDEPPPVQVARDGERVHALDLDERTVWSGALAAGGGRLVGEAGSALMWAFFDPRALAGEAQSDVVELRGRDEAGGLPCVSVQVSYDDDEEDSEWCFADDGLPRRMTWSGPDGSRTLEIASLTLGDAGSDETFRIDPPPGFEVREAELGPPVGSRAGDWSLPLLGGGTVSLADLEGRVVFLDFWATWCPPCIESLDALDDLRLEMAAAPVAFFAVNTLETGDPAAFVAERQLGVPVLLEGDDLHGRYAPGNLPAFVVIDARGRHAGFGTGYYGELSESHARRLIERALNSDNPAP